MRRRAAILASAAVLDSCLILIPAPARALFGAQDTVICENCASEVSQWVQHGEVILQWAQQARQMVQEYNQLVQTYQAIAHLPDTALQSLAADLNTQQFRAPISTDPNAIVSAITGLQLGGAGASAQQYWQRNNIYTAPGQDFLAIQLASRGNSVAAVLGLMNDLYASATQHAQTLQGLERELNAAPDGKAAQDLGARLQMEQAHLQARQIQAQTLIAFQAAQQRNEDTQRDQLRRCQYDEVIAAGRTQTPLTSTSCGIGMGGPGSNVAGPVDGGVTPATMNTGAGTNVSLTGLNGDLANSPYAQQVSANAMTLGVNPAAVEAACTIESQCRNLPGTGSITGPMQVAAGTYAQTQAEIAATNPSLAASMTGNTDPVSNFAAGTQYLRDAATTLQDAGIANPNGVDGRGYYNFGPAAGIAIARASDDVNMASLLPAGTNLAANGITSTMTVGQWRANTANRMGSNAYAPILLPSNGT